MINVSDYSGRKVTQLGLFMNLQNFQSDAVLKSPGYVVRDLPDDILPVRHNVVSARHTTLRFFTFHCRHT